MDAYMKIVEKLKTEVFGYEDYFKSIVDFYSPYFSYVELENFLFRVYNYKIDVVAETIVPRVMINSVQRLVTLADDIEKIRPQKNALKSFFLVVCIESLYSLARDKRKKYEMVIDFFENYISKEDQIYILERIERSFADDMFIPGHEFNESISIEIFARIISEVRNIFTHQGDYWSFNFASFDPDTPVLQSIIVEEERSKGKAKRLYEIRFDYDSFREICIKGFISYINKYIECGK
ncbi:MAG: hypothetical protein ACQEXX_12810 [Bacillota bacterium]